MLQLAFVQLIFGKLGRIAVSRPEQPIGSAAAPDRLAYFRSTGPISGCHPCSPRPVRPPGHHRVATLEWSAAVSAGRERSEGLRPPPQARLSSTALPVSPAASGQPPPAGRPTAASAALPPRCGDGKREAARSWTSG